MFFYLYHMTYISVHTYPMKTEGYIIFRSFLAHYPTLISSPNITISIKNVDVDKID